MIAVVLPAVRSPTLARMFRTPPLAWNPNVVVAIVAVIAGDPHISPIRRRTPVFVDGRRWTDANRDLRK
jgi:hypothetical protein